MEGLKVGFLGIDGKFRSGLLTTDHAMSSYGLPVIATSSGAAYGVGEVDEVYVPDDQRDSPLVEAARRAGYKIAERERR